MKLECRIVLYPRIPEKSVKQVMEIDQKIKSLKHPNLLKKYQQYAESATGVISIGKTVLSVEDNGYFFDFFNDLLQSRDDCMKKVYYSGGRKELRISDIIFANAVFSDAVNCLLHNGPDEAGKKSLSLMFPITTTFTRLDHVIEGWIFTKEFEEFSQQVVEATKKLLSDKAEEQYYVVFEWDWS